MKLFNANCLDRFHNIKPNSVNLVLCDPPYGVTINKWDRVIDFDLLWEGIKHVLTDDGIVVMFGQEPFSSRLRLSNLSWYKYDWVWDKGIAGNFLNAKIQPLSVHENILVFMNCASRYNPVMATGKMKDKGRPKATMDGNYKGVNGVGRNINDQYYPQSILRMSKGNRNSSENKGYHPTQKPVPLMEYLIETYSNIGDTVLDFAMGSGSTAIAAVNKKRSFIGIEIDIDIYNIAKIRIDNHTGKFHNNDSASKDQLSFLEDL